MILFHFSMLGANYQMIGRESKNQRNHDQDQDHNHQLDER